MFATTKLAMGTREGKARVGVDVEKPGRAGRDKKGSGGAPVNAERSDLNDSNRPVRTRMPGGVGGCGHCGRPHPDTFSS